jgi:hypothetical protein
MCLDLQSGLHNSGFPTKIAYAFLTALMHAMSYPSHPPSFDDPNNIWQWLQIVKLLIMQFSPPLL